MKWNSRARYSSEMKEGQDEQQLTSHQDSGFLKRNEPMRLPYC